MRMFSKTAFLNSTAITALAGSLNTARFDGMTPEMKALQTEIKGYGDDVKGLKGSMENDLADLRKLIDETKAGSATDPLLKKQVEDMSASVATKHEALEKSNKSMQEALDKLEVAFKRLPVGPAGDIDKKAIADAIDFFQTKATALGQLTVGQPIDPEKMDKEGYELWEKQYGLYLRKDDKFNGLDQKALSVGSNPDGGYLVPTQRSARIITRVFETSPMRGLASIETIGTSELELPIDMDELDAGWVGETQARTETGTPRVGVQKIPVHELYANPRATQKFLEDASINVEAWLSTKLGDKFGRVEASAFIAGNGINMPRGILTYAEGNEDGGVRDRIPQYASGDAAAITGDALVSMPLRLKSAYLSGASWLMKRSTIMAIMLLKDGQGQYLWRPGLQAGVPSILNGYDVNMADDMPAVSPGALSVAFGNWKQAYTIVDRLGITTLRDPYTAKPFVQFYSRKRVGGDVVDFDALALMVVAAS